MSSIKAELRNEGLKRRDGIDLEVRARFASRLAVVGPDLVLDFAAALKEPVASLFSAIGSEPDTMPLALALDAADVRIALPVDWSPGSALVYRGWSPGDRLAAGPLGIGEPADDAPELEPDVLFVPLAVFDRRGHRIGYGAGNVDRTLRSLRARKTVRVVGVAYAVQEELLIPSEPHDEPVDIVLTDREIIVCRE